MCNQFFQDHIRHNNCFGCAPGNPHGFRIKSSRRNDTEAVCRFTPRSYHSARSTDVVNGGVIATIVDCHCICTAIADAYLREGRDIGEGDDISYVTAALNIKYIKPAPTSAVLELVAQIQEITPKKTILHCTVSSQDTVRAEATVTAFRIYPTHSDLHP